MGPRSTFLKKILGCQKFYWLELCSSQLAKSFGQFHELHLLYVLTPPILHTECTWCEGSRCCARRGWCGSGRCGWSPSCAASGWSGPRPWSSPPLKANGWQGLTIWVNSHLEVPQVGHTAGENSFPVLQFEHNFWSIRSDQIRSDQIRSDG